jgi:sigma-B regulation protein RsbU (phosphoserine phosphatase)
VTHADQSAGDRLRILEAITDTALAHLELDKFLTTMLTRVRDLLEVDTATVLMHDAASEHLVATAASGIEEEVFQSVRVPVGAGFAGRVARERRPVIIDHVDDTTVFNPLLWERGLHTLLGVPMIVHGDLLGVLHVGSVSQRRFSDAEVELLQLVADRMSLAAQAQVSHSERAAAVAMQRSLLPGAVPPLRGLEFATRYVPGAESGLGGDWYDVFRLEGERVGIVVGDVAGHGLNAAVVMGRLRSALRAYALDWAEPNVVLAKLDRKANHFEHGTMTTISYAVLEPSQQRLHLSLAGHLPPVLARPGAEPVLVEAPVDPPIGFGIADTSRRSLCLDLPFGATLAFYTDGLVERRGQSIDEGLELLRSSVTAEDAVKVSANIMSQLIGKRPSDDDVALLVAHHRGESGAG